MPRDTVREIRIDLVNPRLMCARYGSSTARSSRFRVENGVARRLAAPPWRSHDVRKDGGELPGASTADQQHASLLRVVELAPTVKSKRHTAHAAKGAAHFQRLRKTSPSRKGIVSRSALPRLPLLWDWYDALARGNGGQSNCSAR